MLLVASVNDHFLVPKQYLLPKEQAEKVLQEFGFKREQMPMIQKNDPAIKDFKAEKGDLIKIVRHSQTAGKTIYYRVVV